MRLFRDLWKDEGGFIISAELILIATVLVVGVMVGLSCLQKAVVGELTDVAGAFNTLDQSFYYHGHSSYIRGGDGCIRLKSAVLGSSYVDRRHRIIGTEADLSGFVCPPGTPGARAQENVQPELKPKARPPQDYGPNPQPGQKGQPCPETQPCPQNELCPKSENCPKTDALPKIEGAPGSAATADGQTGNLCQTAPMYPPVDFWGTPLPPIMRGRAGIGRPCETFVMPFYTPIPPYLLMSPGNIARLPRPCAPAPGATYPGYNFPGVYGPGFNTPGGVTPGATTPGLDPQPALPADPAQPTPAEPKPVPQLQPKSKIL